MGIESNEEAYQTMKKSIGSMENRMREIYNKGYKDGIKEGINRAMQKIADSILEEIEIECNVCRYAWWDSAANRYECSVAKCPYSHKAESQTERSE